jgi:hypothetical protein
VTPAVSASVAAGTAASGAMSMYFTYSFWCSAARSFTSWRSAAHAIPTPTWSTAITATIIAHCGIEPRARFGGSA